MSECADDTVRDLIPEYLLGTLDQARRESVAAHVERCRSCALEVSMLRAAHRVLDAAPPVDIARIVRALPAPPAAAPALTLVRGGTAAAAAPRRRRSTSWRLAATIATVAVSAISVGVVQSLLHESHPRPTSVTTPVTVPVPASAVVQAPVPVAAPPAAPAGDPETAGVSAAGSLSDLSDSEMQTLLTDIDNLDAVPAAEPQPTVSGLHRVVGEQ